jgi:hypothetical protein
MTADELGMKSAYPGPPHSHEYGLTKRELFAAMALQGILACDRHKMADAGVAAKDSVLAADALLAELAKEPQP